MHKTLIGSLLVVTAFFLCPARAAAQADAFMYVANIPGESTDDAHKDWISVISLTQSFDAGTRSLTACGAEIEKGFDKAGPQLWLAAVTGQRLGEVRVEVIKQGGEDRPKLYELKISNARISSITSTPSSLAESLQIVGDSALLTYYFQKPDGSLGQTSATVNCK